MYVSEDTKSRAAARGEPEVRRATQAERSARSRNALLESAARGISRYGYYNLALEEVARDAGYTRGALYHQFTSKEDLALAVVEWAEATWTSEVGDAAAREPDPVSALIAMARGHAVLCRRDVARVRVALRAEFGGREHPIGREIERASEALIERCARLVKAGRREGTIPPGAPANTVARAFVGAIEGAVIAMAGRAPADELMSARAGAGVLGLAPETLEARLSRGA
jgi:AcrR family transcriptional regulator